MKLQDLDYKILCKLLQKVDSVSIYYEKWKFKNLVRLNHINVFDAKWGDSYRNEYITFDFSKDYLWSSYESCYSLKFYIEANQLCCKIITYESKYGEPTFIIDWEATFVLPDIFIKNIEYMILKNIECLASDAYEQHLIDVKKKWEDEFIDNLIKSL